MRQLALEPGHGLAAVLLLVREEEVVLQPLPLGQYDACRGPARGQRVGVLLLAQQRIRPLLATEHN